jgi:hypothetical protein
MGWAMLYLFVFLKLPIVALCWIVWWAVHQTDDPQESRSDGGTPCPRRPHPRPRRPKPPRRGGPACGTRMSPPPRIRSVTAAGRARELHQ